MVDCRESTTVNQTVSSRIDIAMLMVIAKKKLFVSLRKRFLKTIYVLFRSHIETLAANRHICLVSLLRTCKKNHPYIFLHIDTTYEQAECNIPVYPNRLAYRPVRQGTDCTTPGDISTPP